MLPGPEVNTIRDTLKAKLDSCNHGRKALWDTNQRRIWPPWCSTSPNHLPPPKLTNPNLDPQSPAAVEHLTTAVVRPAIQQRVLRIYGAGQATSGLA